MILKIYVEGDYREYNKSDFISCQSAFKTLFQKCGFVGKQFSVVASGGRDEVWNDFIIAHSENSSGVFVGMLIDSDKPVPDTTHNYWEVIGRARPDGANNDQVLLMVTSMDSWIAADRNALSDFYGDCLDKSKLPKISELELIDCVPDLKASTANCGKKQYAKGSISFQLLAKIDPKKLEHLHISSFVRVRNVMNDKLNTNS